MFTLFSLRSGDLEVPAAVAQVFRGEHERVPPVFCFATLVVLITENGRVEFGSL